MRYKDDVYVKNQNEIFSTFCESFHEEIEETVSSTVIGNFLILGLSKVGKSSIVKRVKNKDFSSHIKPTLTLSLINLLIESHLFKAIDVSGQKNLRSQWFAYTTKPDAVMFVIDINEIEERLNETKKEFASVVEKLIPMESPLLICLNKIDLFQDFSSKEPELTLSFKELLNLDKLDLP